MSDLNLPGVIMYHLDQNPVLTVMDAVTNQHANATGVNLHTGPLQTATLTISWCSDVQMKQQVCPKQTILQKENKVFPLN